MATATTTVPAVVSAPAASNTVTATTNVPAVVSAPVAPSRTATTTITAVVSAPAAGTRSATTSLTAVASAPPTSTEAGFYRYSAADQTLIALYVYRWTGGVLKPVGGDGAATGTGPAASGFGASYGTSYGN